VGTRKTRKRRTRTTRTHRTVRVVDVSCCFLTTGKTGDGRGGQNLGGAKSNPNEKKREQSLKMVT